jgi:hypothetical protein
MIFITNPFVTRYGLSKIARLDLKSKISPPLKIFRFRQFWFAILTMVTPSNLIGFSKFCQGKNFLNPYKISLQKFLMIFLLTSSPQLHIFQPNVDEPRGRVDREYKFTLSALNTIKEEVW